MRERIIRSIARLSALAAAAWVGSFVPVAAAGESTTTSGVSGGIESKPSPCAPGSGGVLCTAGRFTGDLEGPFTFTVDTVVPSGVEGYSLLTETVVARTGRGDLILQGAVVANLRSGRFVGLARVTGGTGTWEGSTGEVRWWSAPTTSGGRAGAYNGVLTAR